MMSVMSFVTVPKSLASVFHHYFLAVEGSKAKASR